MLQITYLFTNSFNKTVSAIYAFLNEFVASKRVISLFFFLFLFFFFFFFFFFLQNLCILNFHGQARYLNKSDLFLFYNSIHELHNCFQLYK